MEFKTLEIKALALDEEARLRAAKFEGAKKCKAVAEVAEELTNYNLAELAYIGKHLKGTTLIVVIGRTAIIVAADGKGMNRRTNEIVCFDLVKVFPIGRGAVCAFAGNYNSGLDIFFELSRIVLDYENANDSYMPISQIAKSATTCHRYKGLDDPKWHTFSLVFAGFEDGKPSVWVFTKTKDEETLRKVKGKFWCSDEGNMLGDKCTRILKAGYKKEIGPRDVWFEQTVGLAVEALVEASSFSISTGGIAKIMGVSNSINEGVREHTFERVSLEDLKIERDKRLRKAQLREDLSWSIHGILLFLLVALSAYIISWAISQ